MTEALERGVYLLWWSMLGLLLLGLAMTLSGCPIRVDPPPPSSCLQQQNCGLCTSHATAGEGGCIWCNDGCHIDDFEGCEDAPATILEQCEDETE